MLKNDSCVDGIPNGKHRSNKVISGLKFRVARNLWYGLIPQSSHRLLWISTPSFQASSDRWHTDWSSLRLVLSRSSSLDQARPSIDFGSSGTHCVPLFLFPILSASFTSDNKIEDPAPISQNKKFSLYRKVNFTTLYKNKLLLGKIGAGQALTLSEISGIVTKTLFLI